MALPTACCSSCWATGRVVLVDVDVAGRLVAVRVVSLLGPAAGVVVTGLEEDVVVVADGAVEVDIRTDWTGLGERSRQRALLGKASTMQRDDDALIICACMACFTLTVQRMRINGDAEPCPFSFKPISINPV